MDNESEKPKKIPKKRKPKTTLKKENLNALSENQQSDEIKKLLSRVIMQDMLERENSNMKDIEMSSLVAMNQEFLKCFMIIGYDMNEVPVCIFQANSQLQADALSSAVTKLVFSGGKNEGF